VTSFQTATADSVISALSRMRSAKLRIVQDDNGSFFIVSKTYPKDSDTRQIHDIDKRSGKPKNVDDADVETLELLSNE
jgi:hypothetical protein